MLYVLLSNIVWTESDCLAGMVDGGGRVVAGNMLRWRMKLCPLSTY